MPEEKSYIKTIEQGRAVKAYEYVQKAPKDKKFEEYKSGVKKLPILIKTNGLGQALAFIKKRDNFPDIYKHLSTWLQKDDPKQLVPEGDLVEQVIKMNSEDYRQVTLETLALLNWMKRFVDGRDETLKEA